MNKEISSIEDLENHIIFLAEEKGIYLKRTNLPKIIYFSIFDSIENYNENKKKLSKLLEKEELFFSKYGPVVKGLYQRHRFGFISKENKKYNKSLSFLDEYILKRMLQEWGELTEESHKHKLWRENRERMIRDRHLLCTIDRIIENFEDYYDVKVDRGESLSESRSIYASCKHNKAEQSKCMNCKKSQEAGSSRPKTNENNKEILSWDEYFMSLAHLSAMRSKDPNTQVGACIVNKEKRVVGIGYNGMPYGCSDDEYPWEREGEMLETKYPYVVHAELNAILNATSPLSGCSIYVSLFPCNECSKAIIQSGIREIVYESDKYKDTDSVRASKRMLESAGVTYRKVEEISVSIN